MKTRFSIVGLMGMVAVAALGLVPLTRPSPPWAGGMLMITCGVLAMSTVGVVASRGIRRIRWQGFALFGWGYLFLSGCYRVWWLSWTLPTSSLIRTIGIQLGLLKDAAGDKVIWQGTPDTEIAFIQIALCLLTLLFAVVGSLLAGFLFASTRQDAQDQPEIDRPSRSAGSRWFVVMVGGLIALIVAVAAATVSDGIGVSALAGTTLLLTCTFHGLSMLAAILRRGRTRAAWLGAAFFGVGYTAILLSRPSFDYAPPDMSHLATEPILDGLRFRFERIFPSPRGRIWRALDRPVPMTFPNEVSLKDLVEHIKRETAEPNQPELPIYVDPIGLQVAERSWDSTIRIDLKGLPLRTTLTMALKQLELCAVVKNGYLHITSIDSQEWEEYNAQEYLNDPFRIVGDCLLSLAAAGFGALAALVITRPQRGTSAEPA